MGCDGLIEDNLKRVVVLIIVSWTIKESSDELVLPRLNLDDIDDFYPFRFSLFRFELFEIFEGKVFDVSNVCPKCVHDVSSARDVFDTHVACPTRVRVRHANFFMCPCYTASSRKT